MENILQLLGEEMYSTKERSYKRGDKYPRSELSSRSASPDMSRNDNMGYEDSLDVAFEHNNKLRDKIQQRMRESENLISNLGQRDTSSLDSDSQKKIVYESREAYHHREANEKLFGNNSSQSTNYEGKVNNCLGGLIDKALSSFFHDNGKPDHKYVVVHIKY